MRKEDAMKIGHLRERVERDAKRDLPERLIFGVWDATVGNYVERAEWIVVVAENAKVTVDRLKGVIDYFSSMQCSGVSSDVQQIMTRFGMALSRQWKVYRTAK
ncbi:hypothetical protein HZB93_03515 [Candidatus Falkowbacteria bacterium]|nr:hypothetical protein [Candidatus Falkowbacteria bacterium]